MSPVYGSGSPNCSVASSHIFFYTKNGTTIMIDAGYNYDRLKEKMGWLDIDGIRVECLLVPGHTWGHMAYLIDDAYLFTGDTLWFGADGGYSFINGLAEDNDLSRCSLAALEKTLRERKLCPKIITGHTGWTDNPDFAFAHRDQVCNGWKKQKPHDPKAPYDGYDETDDTKEKARTILLAKQDENIWRSGIAADSSEKPRH